MQKVIVGMLDYILKNFKPSHIVTGVCYARISRVLDI
jgi:hypothetical protein